MTNMKLIERSATPAFFSGGGMLAAGTVAGAIDMSFSTSSVLEVFSLDFADRSETPVVIGSVPAPERFHRLAWGGRTPDAAAGSMGILAGGLADGSVCLWDPAVIVDKSAKAEGHTALLAKLQKHTGAVKGLEFNPTAPNLLASGAADSDLCIWDLTNPSKPSLYPALKSGVPSTPGSSPPPGSEITYVAWNRKVQHILASCSSNGTTVVWDLKRQKPVISFRDANSQRRCSSIQWNPEVATQLIVASDDDRGACTLQMWDLRNSVGAIREFVGHDKGVLGMAWSTHDPSLLLSSGKDNRTLVWDVQSADILCELPIGNNWNFDVQWSPTIPGVFTTASYDGKIGVTSIHACTGAKITQTVNADFSVTSEVVGDSTPLKRAPAWMRRPVGVTWGFGGRLLSFSHTKQTLTDPQTGVARVVDHCLVTTKQVVTEEEIVARSEAFERAIDGGERPTLREFCVAKTSSTEGEEGETWAFLSVLFEDDARRQLLTRLGFQEAMKVSSPGGALSADAIAAGLEGVTLSADGKPLIAIPGASGNGADTFDDNHDDPDFFDNLPEQGLHLNQEHGTNHAPRSSVGTSSVRASVDGAGVGADAASNDGTGLAAPSEVEAEIQKFLLIGNYEAAVESCFRADYYTDALLIANIYSADLFKRTMRRYMQRCPRPYTPIMSAMVESDYATLVKTRPVSQWRETLAVLATYTGSEQWTGLCDALAARLAKAGMHHAASLCFICAGNVEGAVHYWAKGVSPASGVDALQCVIEKAVIMGQAATSRKSQSVALSDLVTSYAAILAAQGRMSTALDYLEHVPGEASTTVAVLKDRIYRSGAAGIPNTFHAPPFPFVRDEVHAAPMQAAPAMSAASSSAAAGSQYAPNAYGNTSTYGGGAAAYNTAYGQQPQQQQQQQNAYVAAAPAPVMAGRYSTDYGTSQPAAAYGGAAAAGGYAAAPAAANAYAAAPAAASSSYNAYANQYQQQQQYGGGGGSQYSTATAAPPQQQAPQYAPEPVAVYQAKRAGGPPASAAVPAPPLAPVVAAPVQQQQYAAQPVAQQQYAPAVAQQQQYAPQQPAAQAQYAPQQPAPQAQQQQAPQAYAAQQPAAQQAYGQQAGQQQQQYAPQAQAYGGGAGGSPMGYAPQQAGPMQPTAPAPAPLQVVQQPAFFVPTASTAAPAPYAAAAQQQQQPMMAAMQQLPAAPVSQKAPAAPPAPAGPPANISVQTADVSQVQAAHQPIVQSLTNLFNSCMPLANNPAKKREMDDNSKKVGQLFWRLNGGDVSEGVVPKLLQLCAAVDANDWHAANHIQVQMTTTDWDECGYWLSAVKRLVKMRQTL